MAGDEGQAPQVAEMVDRNPCLSESGSESRSLARLLEEVKGKYSGNPDLAGLDRIEIINPEVEFTETKRIANGGKGGRIRADKRIRAISNDLLLLCVLPEIAPCPPLRDAESSSSCEAETNRGDLNVDQVVNSFCETIRRTRPRVEGSGTPDSIMARARSTAVDRNGGLGTTPLETVARPFPILKAVTRGPRHKTARKKRYAANRDSVVRKGAVGRSGSPPPLAKVHAVPEAAMGSVDGLGSPAPPVAKVRSIPKSSFQSADPKSSSGSADGPSQDSSTGVQSSIVPSEYVMQ